MDKIAGLDHNHAGGAAIRVAVGQPEEGHPLNLTHPVDRQGGWHGALLVAGIEALRS
jgi:hypothetical protein